jgi:hypothetical protein
MLAFLQSETEDYQQLTAEFSDEGQKNFGKLAYAMYCKGMKMQEMYGKAFAEKEEMCGKFAEVEEKNKAYMAENDELKKFKADVEERQFKFEVESTMKEIENAVEMPKDEFASLFEKAKEFSLQSVDAWKNLAKAKAFTFSAKSGKKEEGVKKYALPWNESGKEKKGSSPWVR